MTASKVSLIPAFDGTVMAIFKEIAPTNPNGSTIREEVAKSNPLGGFLQFVQTPSAQTPAEKENKAETEEAVLDFLDSF